MNVEDFCVLVHVFAYFLITLEQRVGYEQQIQVKMNFFENKHGGKKPRVPLRQCFYGRFLLPRQGDVI